MARKLKMPMMTECWHRKEKAWTVEKSCYYRRFKELFKAVPKSVNIDKLAVIDDFQIWVLFHYRFHIRQFINFKQRVERVCDAPPSSDR